MGLKLFVMKEYYIYACNFIISNYMCPYLNGQVERTQSRSTSISYSVGLVWIHLQHAPLKNYNVRE